VLKNDGIDYVESKQIKEDHYDEINHLLSFDIVHFELCDLFSLYGEVDLHPVGATWEKIADTGVLTVLF
jgi:hypothetical protein